MYVGRFSLPWAITGISRACYRRCVFAIHAFPTFLYTRTYIYRDIAKVARFAIALSSPYVRQGGVCHPFHFLCVCFCFSLLFASPSSKFRAKAHSVSNTYFMFILYPYHAVYRLFNFLLFPLYVLLPPMATFDVTRIMQTGPIAIFHIHEGRII